VRQRLDSFLIVAFILQGFAVGLQIQMRHWFEVTAGALIWIGLGFLLHSRTIQ